MTNVEFIATYIFNNPGVRRGDVIRAMHKWRGRVYHPRWCRGQWSQYFSRYATASNRYIDTHWTYVEPNKPRSGYVLTSKGLGWVCDAYGIHRNDLK